MNPADLRMDLHVHSIYSDGNGRVEEIVRKAKERGMKRIGIVDHSIEFHFGLTEAKAKRRLMEIENAESAYGIKVYNGVECTIDATGNIILPDFDFDFVIASVHEYLTGEEYYRRVLLCIDNCEFDILGHPFSKLFAFDDNIEKLDEILLDKLEESGIALELNSSHHSPPEEFLARCSERKIPFSIGSDAHDVSRVGMVGWSIEMAKRYMNSSKVFIP